MKKKLLVLSILAASSVAVTGLTSCTDNGITTTVVEKEVSSISVTGAKTVFAVGDNFSVGSLVVTATYADNTTKDVTKDATINSSNVNCSKAGNYKVKINYGGKTAEYDVEVKAYILKSIAAESKEEAYHIGDVITSRNVKVTATYTNPITNEDSEEVLAPKDYTVAVKNSANEEITQIAALGEYTVDVKFNDKTTSIKVNAVKNTSDTVSGAIDIAVSRDWLVASGQNIIVDSAYASTTTDKYVYGDGYSTLEESTLSGGSDTPYVYDKSYFVAIKDANGKDACIGVTTPAGTNPTKDDISHEFEETTGVKFDFFGNAEYTYGAPQLIKYLYSLSDGTMASHFVEEVGVCDKLENTAGFKFGYNLILESPYFGYQFCRIACQFTLTDAGTVDKAYVILEKFNGNGYYNDLDAIPADASFTVTKTTDADGVTSYALDIKADATASSSSTNSIVQSVGAKAAKSELPFDLSKTFYTSFDVKFNGEETPADEKKVINLDLDNGTQDFGDPSKKIKYNFVIDNFAPQAEYYLDEVKATLSGTAVDGYKLKGNGDFTDYAYAFASAYSTGTTYEGILNVSVAGKYILTLSSNSYSKTYVFNVAQAAPSEVKCDVYDGEGSDFVTKDSYEMFVANTLYLKANIDATYTQDYTAVLAEGTTNATLVPDKALEKDCYKFNATQPGTYTVILTGAKPDVEGGVAAKKEVTIVVKANPNVSDILTGTKEAVVNGTTYEVVFSTENDKNYATLTNKADTTKTEKVSYIYSAENGFVVSHESGQEFGFDFVLSSKFVLQLKDANGNTYDVVVPGSGDQEDDALFAGKYTASFELPYPNMPAMTYEATFTATSETAGSVVVSIDNRSGSYNYVYNPATGEVTLTYVEAETSTDVNGNHKLLVQNGKLCINTFGNGTIVELTKEGGSSETSQIHANFIGTWANDYLVVEITENSVSYGGSPMDIVSCTATELVIEDFMGPLTFTYDATAGTITDGNDVLEKQTASTVEIKPNFIGTWANDNLTIVITEDSVMYGDSPMDVVSCTETELVVEDFMGPLTLTYDFTTTSISDGDNVLLKQDSSSEDPVETVDIHTNFQGTWTDPDGLQITFPASASTVEFDGGEFNVVSCTETTLVIASVSDARYMLEFTYDSTTGQITDSYSIAYTKA